jgi:hypothetical protein
VRKSENVRYYLCPESTEPVDPKPAKRVDMTLKNREGFEVFLSVSSVVVPKPEPEP